MCDHMLHRTMAFSKKLPSSVAHLLWCHIVGHHRHRLRHSGVRRQLCTLLLLLLWCMAAAKRAA
jgi:hypothetical protein